MSLPGDNYFVVLGVNSVNRCYNGFVVKGVNTGKELKMTYEQKMKLLLKAYRFANESNKYYELFKECHDKDCYRYSCEFEHRAKGLLDAYEMITGTKVRSLCSSIQNEMEIISGLYK